jgi:hypothetical protein
LALSDHFLGIDPSQREVLVMSDDLPKKNRVRLGRRFIRTIVSLQIGIWATLAFLVAIRSEEPRSGWAEFGLGYLAVLIGAVVAFVADRVWRIIAAVRK